MPLRLRVRLWKLDWEQRLDRPMLYLWMRVWRYSRKRALRAVRASFPDEYAEMRESDDMTADDLLLDAAEALLL